MAKTIDARGLSCPQPVLMTLAEIKKGVEQELTVLVDSEVSQENISRAATSRGWKVTEVAEKDDAFRIEIARG